MSGGWERFKNNPLDRWLDASFRPGGFFDFRTYMGCIRWFLFWVAATYVMWHFDNIFAWYRELRGAPYEIDPAKQSWAQLWAWIIGGTGMATAILAMIFIPIRRHLARKSVKGQWYDNLDITADDLKNKEDDIAKKLG